MTHLDRLHLSMIVPLVIMQVFIASDYWVGISRVPWSIHVHMVTVSAWYILLITQPLLITKGNVFNHRTIGIFGFATAGGVGFTAISLLPNTVAYGRFVEADPGVLGQFSAEFFYAIAISESFLAFAFFFAVYQAILKRKSKEEHAAWLVSTAFIMLFPAVGRGVQNLSLVINGFETPNFFVEIIVVPALISALIIIGSTAFVAARHSMLGHRAIHIAMLVNLIPIITQCFPDLIQPLAEPIKTIFTLRFEGTRF